MGQIRQTLTRLTPYPDSPFTACFSLLHRNTKDCSDSIFGVSWTSPNSGMRLPLSIDVQYHSELEQLALPVNPPPFEEGMTVTDQRISAQPRKFANHDSYQPATGGNHQVLVPLRRSCNTVSQVAVSVSVGSCAGYKLGFKKKKGPHIVFG